MMSLAENMDANITSLTNFGNVNTNVSVINGTGNQDDGSPGIHIFKDPYPMHQFMWRIGIIFAVSGVIILGSFIAMFGVNYTRRRCMFRRHRRRPQQHRPTLAFENQLSVTSDEVESGRDHDNDHVTVHQSCTSSARRWSRDENSTKPRSRSNSRSRSLSPGASGSRSSAHEPSSRMTSNDLEDDSLMHSGLEKARLAFKEDSARFAEYDSTKERVDIV